MPQVPQRFLEAPNRPDYLRQKTLEEFLSIADKELTEETGVRYLLETFGRIRPEIFRTEAPRYLIGLLIAAFPDRDFGPLAKKFTGAENIKLSYWQKMAISTACARVNEGSYAVAEAVLFLDLLESVPRPRHKLEAEQERLESANHFLLAKIREIYPDEHPINVYELATNLIQDLGARLKEHVAAFRSQEYPQ